MTLLYGGAMAKRHMAMLFTGLRLLPIIVGASAVSVLGLAAFRAEVPLDTLRSSSDAVGNFMQTVGGIYAVLLAFIVYVVWGQFNDARTFVEREAASLIALHRTAGGLPAGTQHEIQSALESYAKDVLIFEWAAITRRDEEGIERVGSHLDHVWTAIHACQPANDCQYAVYSEVLSRFNDLSDVRTSRLASARAHIPMLMKLLMYLGAFIVTSAIFLVAVDRFWVHAIMTGALAGAVAHILYLIHDLDEAFSGLLQISKAPFERALRTVEHSSGARG